MVTGDLPRQLVDLVGFLERFDRLFSAACGPKARDDPSTSAGPRSATAATAGQHSSTLAPSACPAAP